MSEPLYEETPSRFETKTPRYLVTVELLAAVVVIEVGVAEDSEIVVYGPPEVPVSFRMKTELWVKLLLT